MRTILILIFCLVLIGCRTTRTEVLPRIEFERIPPADEGGPDKIETIAGRVRGANAGQKIVIYARSGSWWVQPFANQSLTGIQADSTWQNSTHLGTEYAALLVEPGYKPPVKADILPTVGEGVAAIATVEGTQIAASAPKIIKFSGYDWKVRTMSSDRGGVLNRYSAENAWTDEKGFLHLRITRDAEGKWNCAEISLTRSLGYGTYNVTVQDTSKLEPSAVFSMLTWDDLEAGQNHREMNVEVTRWGDPANKNLRYVIQPFYVPTNVVQYAIPAGTLTHSINWTSGKAEFKTFAASGNAKAVSEYTFSSGVPAAGGEAVHLTFYAFGYSKKPLEKEAEIVIEKFEFLP
jgi:hypothetical protein